MSTKREPSPKVFGSTLKIVQWIFLFKFIAFVPTRQLCSGLAVNQMWASYFFGGGWYALPHLVFDSFSPKGANPVFPPHLTLFLPCFFKKQGLCEIPSLPQSLGHQSWSETNTLLYFGAVQPWSPTDTAEYWYYYIAEVKLQIYLLSVTHIIYKLEGITRMSDWTRTDLFS